MPNTESTLKENGRVYSGDFLMKVGIEPFSFIHITSRVIEINQI